MKFSIIILAIFCMVFASAQTMEQVKLNHDEMMKHFGDAAFLAGKHYYITNLEFSGSENKQASWSSYTSVYISGNEFSAYHEVGKKQVYMSGLFENDKENLGLLITNKIKTDEKINTFQYKVTFRTQGKMGVDVELNREMTDIDIDLNKLITCVLQYAPQIYPLVLSCFQEPNVENCLIKLLPQFVEVYQCVFGKEMASELPKGISQINKNWSLSKSTLFQYIELSNLNIIDRQIKISNYSQNLTYLQVGSEIIGSNVLKVYIVRATYYGTSFSCSGTITLVCQSR